MCNPFTIKSMGFWDYLISDQPCSTVTQYGQTEELIRTAIVIGIILIMIYLLMWLTNKQEKGESK